SHHALMRIMKCCTFTVNFKLHANVISAMAGIPFIALGYRMKTFDFMESIGRTSYVISTDEDQIADKLEKLSRLVQENWEIDKQPLYSKISSYQTNLKTPFSNKWG